MSMLLGYWIVSYSKFLYFNLGFEPLVTNTVKYGWMVEGEVGTPLRFSVSVIKVD